MVALGALLATVVFGALAPSAHAAEAIPRVAQSYRSEVIRYNRYVWGPAAPVATLAGQIEQESAWDPRARSPYASGLTQFTPATARWISRLYPDLAEAAPLDPRWAIRAQSRYMRRLYLAYVTAATECEQMAMALSAYNGGAGHTNRQRRWAREAGDDPAYWFGHSENFCRRPAWACRENIRYPRVILLKRQVKYRPWGRGVDCSEAAQ